MSFHRLKTATEYKTVSAEGPESLDRQVNALLSAPATGHFGGGKWELYGAPYTTGQYTMNQALVRKTLEP